MKKKNIVLLAIFVFIFFIAIEVNAESCSGVFTHGFMDDIKKYLFTPVKWATIPILLILTSVDFGGVVLSGKKDGMEKAKNNFLKRSVAALIIFFAPDILLLIMNLVNNQAISSCLEKFK